MKTEIAFADFVNGRLHLADGRVLPITNLLGSDNEEVDSVNDAVTFVAGTDAQGWVACRMSDFTRSTIH